MKGKGYKFSALKEESDDSCDVAPKWENSECCHRCQVKFGMIRRKHHCRACGQVFCAQCSSLSCILPKFGIEKPVRVCEACHGKFHKRPMDSKVSDNFLIGIYKRSSAKENQVPAANKKTEEELREDEELQLALALSKSEIEQQKKEEKTDKVEENPQMALYLNRSYWENRTEQQSKPRQFSYALTNENNSTIQSPNTSPVKSDESKDSEEMEMLINSVKSQLEIFVNRIKSNLSRGKTVINDKSTEEFYSNITPIHQKLLQCIQQQDEKRLYFERLQDKLIQAKDTRAALDAMRDDHKAALQKEAAFSEQQRQMQLEIKLNVLRQRKQQHQQYLHQMTLQQVQQQQQEMAMKIEQQRKSYLNTSVYGPNSLPSVLTAPTPYISPGLNSLMTSQIQENETRYPQSIGPTHYQHISQPQDFVGKHMIPPNISAIPISSLSVNIPSNKPSNFIQGNPNIPQSIYQPQMTPITSSTISSVVPVKLLMNPMHQQQRHPAIDTHAQPMMPDHLQPHMPIMSPQHLLCTGQPMMPVQHQQPILGQMSDMLYDVPVHLKQYGQQTIPRQQVNPQPPAPNQVEQPKVEHPQVAELISFD